MDLLPFVLMHIEYFAKYWLLKQLTWSSMLRCFGALELGNKFQVLVFRPFVYRLVWVARNASVLFWGVVTGVASAVRWLMQVAFHDQCRT
ncbi:hypothetical protein U1Q18_043304 [Sarracenia purpurea var. burkii]